MEWVLMVTLALGIFMAVASLMQSALEWTPHVRPRVRDLIKIREAQVVKAGPKSSSRVLLMAVAGGMVLGLLLSVRVNPFLGVSGGGALGYAVVVAAGRFKKRANRLVRLREVSLLYEAVDMYIQIGYTVHAALAAGCLVTPGIRKHVEKCLRLWGQGPVRALQVLGEELEVPEGQLLTAVLQQAVQGGPEQLKGVLAEESVKLEKIRERVAEQQIASRPIYQTVYLALPGFTLFAVILFPLGFQVIQSLRGLRAIGF